jgi:hypothetical protein
MRGDGCAGHDERRPAHPGKENVMPTQLLLAASTVGAHTLTTDRLVATLAVAVTLVGAIVGGLALGRPSGRGGNGRSTIALAAGLTGAVVGGLLLATADGGPGTGNGVVGAFVAVVFGLLAALLGGLARSRSGRTT